MRTKGINVPRVASAVLAMTCLATLIHGCGGGDAGQALPGGGTPAVGQQGTGRAVFSVRWPDRDASRLVPVASESIKITLKRGDATVAERLLARPASGGVSDAVFDNLALGDATATATAYPNGDGGGVAQATATVTVKVQAGDNTPLRLTMASTIDRIEVTPSTATLDLNESVLLTATARNAQGEIVLTLPQAILWSADDAAIAAVSPTGTATAKGEGESLVAATEKESGKRGVAQITVRPSGPVGARIAARYTLTLLSNSTTVPHIPDEMNNRGEIVGQSSRGGFFWRAGQIQYLTKLPGFANATAYGINDQSALAGWSGNIGGNDQSTYWPGEGGPPSAIVGGSALFDTRGFAINSRNEVAGDARKMVGSVPTNVSFLARPTANGYVVSELVGVPPTFEGGNIHFAINENRQIAGTTVEPSTGRARAFVWQNDQTTLLPLPTGYRTSVGMGMNDSGMVVGSIDGNSRAVVWKDTQSVAEILPETADGSRFTLANDVNNYGVVVGNVRLPTVGARAAVSANGVTVDLNTRISPDTGWRLDSADCINDQGQIAGIARRDGFFTGYLLTPQ